MKDKTEQIIKASIEVFVDKGFLQATTQEIAKVANVAEVTLYRKFSTKQNLFEFVIKRVLEDKFQSKVLELAEKQNTQEFIRSILKDRLMIISKNIKLVKLLISESAMNNLPEELMFTKVIYYTLNEALSTHFKLKNRTLESDLIAKQIGSILLGYAILPLDKPFYKLTETEQEKLLTYYTNSILANLEFKSIG